MPQLTVPVKLTIIGASVGIALIGVLAAYFRRRKRSRPCRRPIRKTECVVDGRYNSTGVDGVRRYQRRQTRSPIVQVKSPTQHVQSNGGM